MRLIDADEIIIPCMETTTDDYHAQSMVDEAPTVDAIPVSFLEKLSDNAQNEEAALVIDEIIAQWEKENAD